MNENIKTYYIINNKGIVIGTYTGIKKNELELSGNKLIEKVERPEYPSAYEGCLYANEMFWKPLIYEVDIVKPLNITKLEFRKSFSKDELIKIDNFDDDIHLTDDQKKRLKTIIKNFDSLTFIDLTDNFIIDDLQYLVNIGYLTQKRYEDITTRRIKEA